MGFMDLIGPKSVGNLNISVLTRMPRDCTAPALGVHGCTVPVLLRAPHTQQIYDMARNRSNRNNNTTASGDTSKKKSSRNAAKGGGAGGGPPTAVGTGIIAQGPAVVGRSKQTVRFSNTEYVADVSAPAIGTQGPIFTYAVNPVSGLTPWLSRIAGGYELYRFRRLVVTYTPTCGTTTSGVVVGAFDYDAADAPPTNKAQLSAIDGAVRSNVWNKVEMRTRPMDGWYYVGVPGALTSNPLNTDIKTYDMAKFYLGVYNQAAIGPVGELTVSYDVEFARPDFQGAIAGAAEYLAPVGSTITNIAGTSVVANGSPIATLTGSATSGTMRFLFNIPGEYLLSLTGYWGASSAPSGFGAIFGAATQTETSGTTSTLDWLENMATGWSSGSTTCVGYGMLCVSVAQGTAVTIALVSVVNSFQLIRARLANYKKILG